jgi:hypothetical protein
VGTAVAEHNSEVFTNGILSAFIGVTLLAILDVTKSHGDTSVLYNNRWKYTSYALEQFSWAAFNTAFLPLEKFDDGPVIYPSGKWGPNYPEAGAKAAAYAGLIQLGAVAGGLLMDTIAARWEGTNDAQQRLRQSINDAVGNAIGIGVGTEVSVFVNLLTSIHGVYISPGLSLELSKAVAETAGVQVNQIIGTVSSFLTDLLVSGVEHVDSPTGA